MTINTQVYLLPGTMCNALLWQDLNELLGKHITLTHIPIPKSDTLDGITDELLALLPNKQVNLVGFSLGGYIASNFAAKYPNRVNKLFIISNTACALNQQEVTQRKGMLNALKQNGYAGISRQRAMSLLDKSNQTERLINIIIDMDKQLGASELITQLTATTKRENLLGKLIITKLSMTFYYSELDTFINKNWLKELKANNQQVKLITQSGSGHMLPLEQPVLLKKYLEAWLFD